MTVPGNAEKSARQKREAYRKDPRKILVFNAKARARRNGVPFDLRWQDITIPERCPLLDIPLSVTEGVTGRGSPSIDRFIPALGYVRGNVWVISHRANTIKNDASIDELERLVSALRERRMVAA